MRSTTLVGSSSGAAATAISWPSTFCCNQFFERCPVLVLELFRLELAGELLHELTRHLHFGVAHTRLLVELFELGGADLVGPVHRLEHEHPVLQADGGEVLLLAESYLRDSDLALGLRARC